MKNQYTSDINDYITYGLLRALVPPSFKLGVFWMLTPDDGRNDGQKLGYLSQPEKWQGYDPELFNLLKSSVESGRRDIAWVESSSILPEASYFSESIPDGKTARDKVMEQGLASLSACDLLFYDQDNGLEIPSIPKGRRNSNKYLYLDEVSQAWDKGHSLLIYQHFPRIERSPYLAMRGDQLRRATGAISIQAITTGHNCFFLVLREVHAPSFTLPLHTLMKRWATVFTQHTLFPVSI